MSIEIKDKSPKTYMVIGATGSMTSFISKMLEENGVEMHNSKTRWGRKYYEDLDFRELNEDILKRAGQTSFILPTPEEIEAIDVSGEIEELINSKKGKMWGWKDPRNSLTGKKYLPYLEDDAYLICCFRKPEKVLESWGRTKKPLSDRYGRKELDQVNNSIIEIIKEFCEL